MLSTIIADMFPVDTNNRAQWQTDMPTRGGIWIHNVTGITNAIYSCTKPFHLTKPGDYKSWLEDEECLERSYRVAGKLAWRNNGESKFLRMIHCNMEINAPRAWWSHVDTYKVGTVAQSESTMHNLSKQPLTIEQCEVGTTQETVDRFNALLDTKPGIDVIKYNLPEGFLQARVVDFSYASIQTMWYQRHVQERLGWWKVFLSVIPTLPHADWLCKTDDSMKERFR
jgi:hypothetical protein